MDKSFEITQGSVLVSIIMPVYNAEQFIGEAMDSILNQTLSNFEFIIINDGSTDNSVQVIEQFGDPRIQLLQVTHNSGLVNVHNLGLKYANGKYINRVDADDISALERLEMQVQFLEQNPDYDIISVGSEYINERGQKLGVARYTPNGYEALKAYALFNSPFPQSGILMRTSVAQKFKYSPDFPIAEDFYVFSRMIKNHKADVLADTLMYIRLHRQNISDERNAEILQNIRKIYRRNFQYYGIPHTESELDLQVLLSASNPEPITLKTLNEAEAWLLKLLNWNVKNGIFAEDVFKQTVGRIWYEGSGKAQGGGWRTLLVFFKSPLYCSMVSKREKIILLMKCLKAYLVFRPFLWLWQLTYQRGGWKWLFR